MSKSASNNDAIQFAIITLFPDSVKYYCETSIIKRAQEDGLVKVSYWQPRDYSINPNHRIDQKPYGGGPGMVLEAEPFLNAWQKAKDFILTQNDFETKTIFFSPSGIQFDQSIAIQIANSKTNTIFISGRYEGIDQRVVDATGAETYSIGPYVLTGGELPALIMIDAISRQIPGVLGDHESLEENRTASPAVYTRPERFTFDSQEYVVPEVLLSGNHAEIEKWRTDNKL